MISYKLAKKLKDVGFKVGPRLPIDEMQVHGEIIDIPTLSELIEACMFELPEAERYFMSAYNPGRPPKKRFWACIDKIAEAFGETYEEAVANLWLKLNTK